MNSNEIQKDNVKSTLIKIETLQKEYEVTLQQYQEAGKNYITALQSGSSAFTALKGRSWWGTSGLTEGPVETQADCETMCANSEQCSGATFNPVKRYCWTRSGDAAIATGDDNNYALLTEQKAALYVMKNLNDQLLKLNTEINESLKTINPEVKQQADEKNQKQEELTTSYNQLLEQKVELDKQLQEYYSVDQDVTNQSLYVNQQNMSYRIWAFIAFLILFITIKKMSGSEFPPDIITLILSVLILFVIVKYTWR